MFQAGTLTMKMTNHWNRVIYRLWAPIYDVTVNRFFMPGRKRALEVLALRPGERVLIVGVGTGADLSFLPAGVEAVGIDYSPDMLNQARHKLPFLHSPVQLVRGDAQQQLVRDRSFDAAILNLILSVIPDGQICLEVTLRALKPGGRAVIFDKFLNDNGKPSAGRRFVNRFSTFLGTDITRQFGNIAKGCDILVTHTEPSLLHGTYRVILIRKP